MQFATRTDYAIRILLFLSAKRGNVPIRIIATTLGISETYLPKTLKPMREAGFISSGIGTDGGYYMAKMPEKITLWDVMETMEDTMKCNRCLEPDKFCSRAAADKCAMHKIYSEFQKLSEHYWKSITIQDVLDYSDAKHFKTKELLFRSFAADYEPDLKEA